MRILFMGTPDFALFSLRALVEAGEEIVGVVTQPDKPRGRGYTLMPPPVKVYAFEAGLPVYQPETLKGEAFASLLETLSPEVIVVVAYGKILPANVLNYPVHGCVNVHGSLLPAYRGAAPMQRAIIDGCAQTGVTTMKMDVGLDTGDMLLSVCVPIEENDNFEVIHDRLGEAGAVLLVKTLRDLEAGTLTPVPQNGEAATYAAKIEKTDCAIDFSHDAKRVHDLIRGLSPIPLAFTRTPDGKILKVTESRIAKRTGRHGSVGEVISLAGGVIEVACGEGSVALLSVLPEGKKRMRAVDFINGRRIAVGDVLSSSEVLS
ncbi:MAG: methionyl-tRNA formyltransferase [Ruminococcaceae bacterium]|nr:methionyl-tRNA formyltransferase [Oscillospiraceae bacterium]